MDNIDFSDLAKFFETLAERQYKENNLSDITYALCNTNDDFRRFFLSFCFDEKNIDTTDLIREYQEKSSRPDFFFHDFNNQEYIIEVKIYDKNDHFKQYTKTFPNVKYAFIANYTHPPVLNWKIKTWSDFYEKLNGSNLSENTIIKGYLTYLKALTDTKEFKKMNLTECKSLPVLMDNIKTILEKEFVFKCYNRSKSSDTKYFGSYFFKENFKEKFYFWIGMYLPDNTLYISFFNNKEWVADKGLRENIKKTGNAGTDTTYGDFWFPIGKKDLEILCDITKSDAEQQKALRKFITSVLKKIGAEKYLKQA